MNKSDTEICTYFKETYNLSPSLEKASFIQGWLMRFMDSEPARRKVGLFSTEFKFNNENCSCISREKDGNMCPAFQIRPIVEMT